MKVTLLALDSKIEFPGAPAGEIGCDYFTTEDFEIEKAVDGFLITRKDRTCVVWVPSTRARYAQFAPIVAPVALVSSIAKKAKK